MVTVKKGKDRVVPNGRYLIICDFDGTISTADVGYELIKRFSGDGWEEIDRAYCAGMMGSKDAYTQIAALMKASQDEMGAYVLRYGGIDPYFKDFYTFCKTHGFDLVIVSDGFDFYIDAILKKHNVCNIAYFSNVVSFHDDRRVTIEFPLRNEECDKCGNCKRSILRQYRLTYDEIIYIGNGYSDICPAQEADVVFAKEILYDRCMEEGGNCVYYTDFSDIKTHIERMYPFFVRRIHVNS